MSKLSTELQRLYFLPGQQSKNMREDTQPDHLSASASLPADEGGLLELLGVDGRARAMVLGFERTADWEELAGLFQAVQDDLDWPAPAVVVSGCSGYQMWFSLAEPVPLAQVQDFFDLIRRRYLPGVSPEKLVCLPCTEHAAVNLPPALYSSTGKWSAFIDPTMGRMFIDSPGLEMAPGKDRQADMLARLKSIDVDAFQKALHRLRNEQYDSEGQPDSARAELAVTSMPDDRGVRSALNVAGGFSDPERFLLAVMNDPSASVGQRIKAAKALLPYFYEKQRIR